MRKKYLFITGWLLLLAAAGVAGKRTILGPPWVELTRAERRDLLAEVYGNGTVDARVKVNIASKIGGRLQEVLADQGTMAVPGQLLARLDDRELREQARQAAASAGKAAAAVGLERANLEKARANLALAASNSQRFRALAARELVARQEAEQYENVLAVAQAELVRVTAALAAAREEEAAAGAAGESSRARLADTLIRAPLAGVVIRRELEAGATVNPGTPILVLVDPQTVWVKANVDESLLPGVAAGLPATIVLRSGPRLPGEVARLAYESDRVTEELEVDVAFLPPLAEFHLGEQAEVLIVTGRRKAATSLPAALLVTQGKRRGVWTLSGGALCFRGLELGVSDRRGYVEVVSGLDNEVEVVVAEPERLARFKEGQRVRVRR